MFSPQRKLIIVALVCAALFAVGLTQLFLLRFEAGDVYPPYSSLRTDPLGTQALFEGLNRVEPDTAGRNFRPWKEVALETGTTFLVIGMPDGSAVWRRSTMEKLLDRLAQSGGRLVLAFSPKSGNWIVTDDEEDDPVKADEEPAEKEATPPIEQERAEGDRSETGCPEATKDGDDSTFGCDAEYRFGITALGFSIERAAELPEDDVAFRFVRHPDTLPDSIPWRSSLSFQLQHNDWETIYTWQQDAVVARRAWGKGTVVLVADSYLFSNEALRNHRSTGLLAWAVGPGNDVLFDEFNKGIAKRPGMAVLARQYRLHGVFAALLVVALLFVWHQSAIFVPTEQTPSRSLHAQPAAGRDTGQGVVHLARQHIPVKELLGVCFNAWQSTAGQRVPQARIDEVRGMIERAAADPRKEIQVQTYQEICELLKQGKRS